MSGLISAGLGRYIGRLKSGAVGDGSALIALVRRMTGAVGTTIEKRLGWNEVCVFEFMTAAEVADVQAGTALSNLSAAIDVTTAVQTAINEAWKAGKRCYMPAGAYKARITLPYYDGVTSYQGDAFELYGDGAGNGFLGGLPYIKGTTVIAPDSTGVTLRYLHGLAAGVTGGNHVYVRGIRFEHDSVNPVVQFDRLSDYSVLEQLEIRQHGTGAGLRCLHAYGGTIKNIHSMNDDLVLANPATRTSVAFDIQAAAGLSGGLLNIEKCTGRGFQTGLNLGNGSNGVVATRVTQFEGSTVTYGILVGAGMVDTVIDTPYFEAVEETCIQDRGRSTKVRGGMFFEGYKIGIDNKYDNYGNSYTENQFHLNSSGCTAIAVKSLGDSTGTKKFVRDNLFYFLGSGGSLANVVGLAISGTDPQIDAGENVFRPARAWVGGVGTAQVVDTSSGRLSGSVVTSDVLNSYKHISGVGVSLSYTGNSVTQSAVSGGVLTLPAESSVSINASAAVSVTSIAPGRDRIVVLKLSNGNMTFLKGPFMKLSGDFSPLSGGVLTLELLTISGSVYAYEIARTQY